MKTRMNKLNKLINKTHYSNSTIKNKRFYFLLSIILIITIVGIVIKISFFNLFIYYFFLLYLFFILNKSARSNKYLDNILSESNIIIRLLIPIINLPFGFNLIVICLIKFIITILSRIYLLDKLTYKSSIFTLIFCLGSNFVSPIITIYLLEFYMITINNYNNMGNYSVINSMFPNERRLSN